MMSKEQGGGTSTDGGLGELAGAHPVGDPSSLLLLWILPAPPTPRACLDPSPDCRIAASLA